MKKALLILLSVFTCIVMAFAFVACDMATPDSSSKKPLNHDDSSSVVDDSSSTTTNTVSKITIKTNPTVTEYWVGETLSLEGGVITVTYKDKTTQDVPMTDAGVSVNAVNMANAAVSKTVKVTYSGKSVQFTIKVKEVGGNVTFDYNYVGSSSSTNKYEAGQPITTPETPVRTGFAFDAWYTDENCTVAYDFNTVMSGDFTLYAFWKDNAKTYVDYTYDYNYYGVARQTYTQKVAVGDSPRALGLTPVRAEFAFGGWYNDEGCTSEHLQGAVTTNKTVYAKWTQTKQGTSTYKFEGENCDMDDQDGPGLSGSAGGGAMMVSAVNPGVSGKVVSYLYKEGLHVDFALACSEDTTVTLKVYLCAEFDINLNSSMYKMKLINSANPDGLELSYEAVQLKNGAAVTCITFNNVQLVKGANIISLITANSANPTGIEGSGTYKGTAPMIDCIEVETTAVVIWDATKGLPKYM